MKITYKRGEKKNALNITIELALHYPPEFNTSDENEPAIRMDLLKRLQSYIDKEFDYARANWEAQSIKKSNQGDLFK
jgi:hypothetical protein